MAGDNKKKKQSNDNTTTQYLYVVSAEKQDEILYYLTKINHKCKNEEYSFEVSQSNLKIVT